MATPIIQKTGSVSGPSVADQGSNDLIAGELVSLADLEAANALAVYNWTFGDVPLNTAPVMLNPTTATPSFVVDPDAKLAGSYVVKCTVNGIESSVEIFGKPLTYSGGRIPSYKEQEEYDGDSNAKGWHEAETTFKRTVDELLGDVKASITERQGAISVPSGSSSKEIELGGVIYPGYLLAIAGKLEKAVVSGSIALNIKVGGVLKFTTTLSTINPTFSAQVELPGTFPVVQGDSITVEIVGTNYINSTTSASGLALTAVLSSNLSNAPLTIGDASNTSKGITKLSIAPDLASEPIALGANDGRIPLQNENDALQGTSGVPAAANRYVTDADARNTDSRVPTAHTHTESEISDLTHTAAGGPGTDTTAIHDNAAAEISVLTEKVAPVGADHVLIEDSEAGNVKKRVALSNMLGGRSAAAQGDFIHVTLGAPTQSPAISSPLDLDTTINSSGTLIANATGRISGLKANRRYRLTAWTRIVVNTPGTCQWRDITGGVLIGQKNITYTVDNTANVSSQPSVVAYFTPTVDSEVELWATSSGMIFSDTTHALVEEIGAIQAEVIGGLEYLDTIKVTSAVASIVFGAGGNGLLGTALDGDVDEEYIIRYWVRKTATATTLDLKPNSIGTNQVSKRLTVQSSVATFPRMVISQPPALGFESGEIVFSAKAGRERAYHAITNYQASSPPSEASQHQRAYVGTWDDIAVAITSLEIITDDASAGIDVGSEFVLYRRTRNNLRADSAAVYERRAELGIPVNVAFSYDVTLGRAIYGGSLAGMEARLEDDINSGSVTIDFKVNAVSKLLMTVDLNSPNVAGGTTELIRKAIGEIPITAGDHISLTVASAGLNVISGDPTGILVNCHLVNSGLITQNDRVVAKTVLNANATTLSITGLNGDMDGTYEIEGTLFLTALANDVLLAPNGDVANMKSARHANTTITNGPDGKIVISGAVSTRNEFNFRCMAYVSRTKNGVTRIRSFQFTASHTFDSGVNLNTHNATVAYENSAVNLTGLDFTCSAVGGILAGSEVVVRRIKA